MPSDKPGGADRETEISLGLLSSLLGYNLRRAQVAVFQNFTEVVGASELTPGQFGVLVVIEANPGLSQTQLGNALGIDRSTVVAVIDRLESRGLVARQPAPTDRRSHALHLSDSGKTTLRRLTDRVRAHERQIARHLSANDQTRLVELLRRVARE
ncbi:MAG TPA: MarR family transcriptional regulator [Stellaceae bacterium]|nr:MarR family transcriptional regulator [Stellaceae bacterium]